MAQMSNEQWQELVVALADITDEKAREQQLTKTAMELGGNFTQVSQYLSNEVKSYLAQHQDKGPSLNVTQFNTPVGGLQVQGNAAFDQEGKFVGSSTSVQTGVMDNSYGAASVGVTTALDAQGNLTTVSPHAKYVGPAFGTEASSPVAGVPIASVGVNVPMNGDLQRENVNGMVGVAAWHKDTGVSSITTVSTNAALDGVTVGENLSGDVYRDENVRVALNAGVNHNFGDHTTGASGGVLVRGDVDRHVQLYAGANVGVSDIGGTNDVGVGVQLGANFDFNDKSAAIAQKTQAPVQATQQAADAAVNHLAGTVNLAPQAQQQTLAANYGASSMVPNMQITQGQDGRQHTTINPHGQQMPNAETLPETARFLSMSHKQQVALVDRMADNYAKSNPGMAREEAREAIVHALLNNPQQNQAQTVEASRG